MSYTEIYAVNQEGTVEFVDEVQNAFRSAMHVWAKLSDAYGIVGGMFTGYKELWQKADTGELKDFEDIVLKSTFDRVMVQKEDMPMLIEAFKEYDKHYPNSSLVEQAEIIEQQILHNDNYLALCWRQTSVSDNLWEVGYDEENEETIYYNTGTGDKHWFLKKQELIK